MDGRAIGGGQVTREGKFMAKVFFKYLLVVFFVASGLNHFRVPDFYVNIMPDYLPAHEFLVMLSGVTEVVAGLMLAVPGLSRWGAWFIIAHLLVFFTVHFWMIQHAEDLYSDIPLAGLWLRIPIQVLFIVWTYWFVSPGGGKSESSA